MDRKCKLCPYFLSSKLIMEQLEELKFWAKFAAIHKTDFDPQELAEIKVTARKIEAVLKLIYGPSLDNQNKTKGDNHE